MGASASEIEALPATAWPATRAADRHKCVEALTRTLEHAPCDLQARRRRAELLGAGAGNAEALPDLDAALTLDPNCAVSRCARAGVRVQLGRAEEALEDAEVCLYFRPTDLSATRHKGHALLLLGRLGEARVVLDAYCAGTAGLHGAGPGPRACPLGLRLRGLCHEGLGRGDLAAADFQAAYDVDPSLAQADLFRIRRALGARQLAAGRARDALDELRKAVQLEPRDGPALLLRAKTYLLLQKWEHAVVDASAAVDYEAEGAPLTLAVARGNRGRHLVDLNRPRHALEDLEACLAFHHDSLVQVQRGRCFSLLGEHDKAVRDLKACVARDKWNLDAEKELAQALTRRGLSHLHAKDHKAACRDLTRALELVPDDAVALASRGFARMNLRKVNEEKFSRREEFREFCELAIADFDAALRLDPRSRTYENRGLAKVVLERYAEAIPDFTAALELDPTCGAWAQRNFAAERAGVRPATYAPSPAEQAVALRHADWSKGQLAQGQRVRAGA